MVLVLSPTSTTGRTDHWTSSQDIAEQENLLSAQEGLVVGSECDAKAEDLEAVTEETWIEIDDPPQGYPRLDFKPMVLRPTFLIFALIFFLGCLVTLVNFLQQSKSYSFIHSSSLLSHFAFRYLPGLVGTATTVWWQSITSELGRMTPYMTMAASSRMNGRPTWRRTIGAACFPIITTLGAGNWLLLTTRIESFFSMYITPLKSTLFISHGDPVNGWQTEVGAFPAQVLIVIYAALICSTMVLLVYLRDRRTGLKCDPVSLADRLVLLRGSDILDDFDGLDTVDWYTGTRFSDRFGRWISGRHRYTDYDRVIGSLEGRIYRLGYWKKGGDIWHGIRRGPNYQGGKIAKFNSSKPTFNFAYGSYSKSNVVFFSIFQFFCLVLLITCGFIGGRGRNGFFVEFTLRMSPNLGRFLFRGLLTAFAGTISSFLSSTNIFYRVTQPFVGMYEGNPQPASENLLLDYLCCPPVLVSIKAATNGHSTVAYYSSLSLASKLFPILAGALFTFTARGSTIVVGASLRTYCAVLIFLLVSCISTPFAWPTSKRALPRPVLSLGDLISYCYDSKLLTGQEYESAFTLNRPIDTKRHMESKLFLMEEMYEFSAYKTDSGWRVGFDEARKTV